MIRPINTTLRTAVLCVVCALPVSAQIHNHRLFYLNDKRAPLTTLDIVFLGAGSIQDGALTTGLAVTANRLMKDFSKRHGYTTQLETLGTNIEFNTYYENQVISITALSTNLTASVGIVDDLIRRMAITDLELDEAKRKLQRIYEKSINAGDHDILRNYALARTVGVARWFSSEALRQITLEDVRKNCTAFLNADVVFFKAVSDLDSTAVEEALLPFTKNRRRGGFVWSPPTRKNDRLPGHSALIFEHYSHLKNVYCYWLIPIGTVGADNHVPNMVSWTLGRPDSRGLLDEYLRDDLGLVYSTSCSFQSEDDVRFIEIGADPMLKNSEALITKTHEFIEGLAENPDFWTSIGELRANSDFINAHTHGEQTPRRKLYRAADQAMYNFPSREDDIRSVTDAEIRSFLEKYFVEQNLVMMLYGPKDLIIEILERHWPDMTIHVQPVEKAIE